MYSFKPITVKFYFDYNLGINTIEDLVVYKIPKFLVRKKKRAEAIALAELYLLKNIPKSKVITASGMAKATAYEWLCYKKDFIASLSTVLNKLPSHIEDEEFSLMYLILIQHNARNQRTEENKIKIPDYQSTYGNN